MKSLYSTHIYYSMDQTYLQEGHQINSRHVNPLLGGHVVINDVG